MIKVERILCPTDLSTESDEALRYAVTLARSYEAKLVLLHCCEQDSFTLEEDEAKLKTQMNRLFVESLVPHLGLATMNELDWQGLLRPNVHDIGNSIVREAVLQKIDLIVMRSRRRPRAAVLLGSTAETVCRNAPCPVLVTHPLEREWVGMSSGQIDLNRVLIAYDFSRDSNAAMNFGISLAQEYQAEVHLVHVLTTAGHEEPELAWSSSSTGNAYTFTARKLQETLPQEACLWCQFVNVVRYGKVYEEILNYANKHEIDLICMGVSDSDWTIDKLLGSNVDRVLREAPCPVLIVGHRNAHYQTYKTNGGIMSTVRSYIDQTQQNPVTAASIMTDDKQHEVRCGMCAKELYVDDEGYRLYMEAITSGLDNPFRCEVCNEEYDDLAYEG